MPSALDALRDQVATSTATAHHEYRELVAALSLDEQVAADVVLQVVGDAGRTLDQLGQDVERLVARREYAAALEGREAAEAVAQLVAEDLEQLLKRRQAAIEEFDRQIGEARARHALAIENVRAAKAAHKQLMDTADPDLLARRRDLYAAREQADKNLTALRQDLARFEAAAAVKIPDIDASVKHDPYAHERGQRDEGRRLAERTKPRVQAAAAEVARIDAELAEVNRQILVP
jgi:hypothetical protein